MKYYDEEKILKRLGLDEEPSVEMIRSTKWLLQQWEKTHHISVEFTRY